MTMTKKHPGKAFGALLLVLAAMLTILSSAALAANSCPTISGNPKKSVTFTMKTGSRWIFSDKMTFTQTKGTATYRSWFGQYKNYSQYAAYVITYSKIVNGKAVKTTSINWDGSSKTIKLDKNCTYRITVRQVSAPTYYSLLHKTWGAFDQWKSTPTWRVSATKGIISCS